MEFFDLPISEVKEDTPNSVLISFKIEEKLRDKFAYKAGQYLTLEKEIEGKSIRRCYSLCSAPYEDELTIAVKKVDGGIFSGLLKNTSLKGQHISVGTPEGRFTVEPDSFKYRKHFFIAAGSGITPVMSMMKALLKGEPLSKVYLLYGNKDQESTMLRESIEQLQQEYPDNFFLENCFSCLSPEYWNVDASEDTDFQGRISPEIIDAWITKYSAEKTTQEYYICGPGEMIEDTIQHLKSVDIPEKYIHAEYFTVSKQAAAKAVSTDSDSSFSPMDRAEVTVRLDGEEINLVVGQEMTILEAVEEAGYYPPFSCRSGTCSTCIAKCEKGKVEMDVDLGLMPDEKEDGFVLTCQSRVASKKIEINYDF